MTGVQTCALPISVRLSHRYISGRQLPDKAISVLDTACAKVALGQAARPATIEENEKHIERLKAELGALEREQAAGAAHDARLRELRELIASIDAETSALRERWEREIALVTKVAELRARAEAAPALPEMVEAKPKKGRRKIEAAPASPERVALEEALTELRALQAEAPLVPMQVDAHVVAEIVAAWTGIPLGKMVKDEIGNVLQLQSLLEERVIGQSHAIAAIAQGVRTARAQLDDPNKPKGVFLFVGPSGVGKTETALALADILYGGERNVITINMSEYQEAHTVSGLKGSPPGYVGYGEGGILTEAVRRKPYSVVLLDEIEKAHPDVLEMFYQVLDKGVMDDAEGREIDFRNTLIILTSNVGSQLIMRECLNKPAEEVPTPEALAELLRPQLYKAFKPAFLGRMRTVPYFPLSDDVLARIVALKLSRIGKRIAANHKADFQFDESLIDAVLARCTEVDSGARNVDHILNGSLLPQMAEAVLKCMVAEQPITQIRVGAREDGEFEYAIQ